MPQPGDTGRGQDTGCTSGPLDLLWGIDEIGREIRRNRRQAHYLLEKGELPGAKKIGGRWCIPRTALHAVFGLEQKAA